MTVSKKEGLPTRRRVVAVCGLLLLAAVTPALATALALEDAQAILERIDELSTFGEGDFASVVTIITEDPGHGVTRQVVQMFRRDREGTFLMLVQAPSTMRGQGYLRVDENLWFYDPESRRFSRTSTKEQFSQTDARNSDFETSSYAQDYRVTAVSEDRLGRHDVYILDLEATSREVTYAGGRLWVAKEPSLPLKVENYSETGRLMRTSLFPSYTNIQGTYIASTMIFVDELVQGQKTRIDLTEISVDPIPDNVFTRAYVERVSR